MTRESKLRVLVIDDEPLARRGVRARLLGHSDMDVVGEAENGLDAVWAVRQLAPDLVFLDVQMPGLDGFGVVDRVGVERMPVVVFLTAHDEHALKAFEARALDYLLKPIDDERFAVALDRARRRIAERRAGAGATPPGPRIAARDRRRVLLLDANEIDWVEADGDYVRLHAGDRGLLLRGTIETIESRLPPEKFVRIYRSTIVNVTSVRELVPHVNREFIVILKNGARLKLSRGYRDRLVALLG
ncbi:MAG: LytTR family DNA-binding domain-containing protein [Gemmatimonadaceae bacterium]